MIPPSNVVSALAGAWILINMTSSLDNGTQVLNSDFAMGARPSGILQYTTTGYMSANIMSTTPADRPLNISYPATPSSLESDWAKLGEHTFSYAGPYSINHGNEISGLLTHGPLQFALVPNEVNQLFPRNYTFFEGRNVLRLSAGTANLYWRRTEPSWNAYSS